MAELVGQYAEQSMPTQVTPWEGSVQARLIEAVDADMRKAGIAKWFAFQIGDRADVGMQTYGTYLGVGNPGRNGDRDLLDELLDGMVYAYERYLSTAEPRYWRTVLRLTSAIKDLHGLDDR